MENESMKILLYRWNAYSELGLLKGLKEKEHTVIEFNKKIKNHLYDDEFVEELKKIIIKEDFDLIISFNYFPCITNACRETDRKYISWIFSSPHVSLYCNDIFYDGNYIFCFDRDQCTELRSYGVDHAYHLPLGVDYTIFLPAIKANTTKIGSDISFVGTLYTDERDYFSEISFLPEYVRGYIEGICESQLNLFGYNLVSESIPDSIYEELKKYIDFHMEENYYLTFEKFIVDIINKKITIMERSRMLSSISRRYKVDLYSGSDSSHIPYINNKGYVHYYNQMPNIFANSKINLNITLRSILSGIPLRVLDIMACGGFVLTNYQQEIAEHFNDGYDLAIYTCLEDAIAKCDFYQRHDSEREKIGINGYNKVKEQFSYRKQLDKMFSLICK